MRSFLTRAAATAGLTAAMGTVLVTAAAPAAYADPLSGCVGLPDYGSVYYACLTLDPETLLPSVSLTGSTPVGTTVPEICYFVDCVGPTPVGATVPAEVSLEPSQAPYGTVVADVDTGCWALNPTRCHYRITYSGDGRCRFTADVLPANPVTGSGGSVTFPCWIPEVPPL